jgi:hypothetical protein
MKHRLSVLVCIGLLGACGSNDAAAPATTTAATTGDSTATTAAPTVPETTDATSAPDQTDGSSGGDMTTDSTDTSDGSGNDGAIVITNLDDIPDECIDIMTAFLRDIEPVVSKVDWQTATMADLESLDTALSDQSTRVDDEMAKAGCNNFEFGADDQGGFALALELARTEAPGVVGWLEFIQQLSDGLNTGDGTSAAVPKDCQGAIDYVRGLVAKADTMFELPVAEVMSVTTAFATIQSECSAAEAAAFFDDPAFAAWAAQG